MGLLILLLLALMVVGGIALRARSQDRRGKLFGVGDFFIGGALGFLLWIPVAMVLGVISTKQDRARAPTAATQPARPKIDRAALESGIRARLPKELPSRWQGVTVEEADERDFRFVLVYRSSPSGHREIERDTAAVAMAAIAELKMLGVPVGESFLSVWARKPETGVTGKQMTRVYGRTIYNRNTDQLEYKPER